VIEIIATIAVVLAIAIAIVLILAATKPNNFSIERATTIKAPPERIFPLINDFHQWGTWSPWENKDPAMKRTFDGAASGKGAVYAWDGNKNVGSGRMEILDTTVPTNVSWLMHGPAPFMSKMMQVFINLDHMIGKDFEIGLANLKRLTEK